MKKQLLHQNQAHDDWLYSKITPLINIINHSEEQIQNKDLQQFLLEESDTKIILQDLKQIIQSEPKNLYWTVFKKQLFWKLLFVLLAQASTDIVWILSLFLLDFITEELQHFSQEKSIIIVFSIMILVLMGLMKTYLHTKNLYYLNLYFIRVKVITQYLLYSKILNVKSDNDDDSIGNLNTLITADIETMMVISLTFRDFFESSVLLLGCLYFLVRIDSHAGLMVIIVISIAQVFNVLCALIIMKAEKQYMEFKDKKVCLYSDILNGIKSIKYLSWESTFRKKVINLRKQEFSKLMILKIFDGLLQIFWNNISYILLCTFIITVINDGKTIQDINIYSLLAVFNTMTFPLGILPWFVNSGVSAYVSLKRILQFLKSSEIDYTNYLTYNEQDNAIEITANEQENNNDYFTNLNKKQKIEYCATWSIKQRDTKKIENNNNYSQITDQNDDIELISIPKKNEDFILHIEKLIIKPNTLNIIIGKAGSGKSALFNCFLNELERIQNEKQNEEILNYQIKIKGKIGYCSQTLWIQNMSIKENICFGKEYDQNLYDYILSICQLKKDISSFPNFDNYLVGPDGKNLSGGQKQRLALARALYQECDIYLFDDIFSSLDIHVADQIFVQAIIEYLMAKQKTVFIITSHYKYINLIPNGINKSIILIDQGNIINDEQQIQNYLNEQINFQDTQLSEYEKNEIHDNKNNYQHNEEEQNNDEERETGKIALNTWTTYFSSMGYSLLLLWFFINFLVQGSTTMIDFWIRSEMTQQEGWLHKIIVYFNFSISQTLFYLTIISVLITFFRAICYTIAGLKAAWTIFSKLNTILLSSMMKFFDTTNNGKILNRIQNDSHMIDNELNWTFGVVLNIINKLTGLSIGLLILEPTFIFIGFFVAFLYYKTANIYVKSNREIKRLKSVNESNLLQIINETLSGLKIIRAFNKCKYFKQEFEQKLSIWALSDQCGERSSQWFRVRLNLYSNLVLVFVCIVICITVYFDLSNDYTIQTLALAYTMIIMDNFYDFFVYYLTLESQIVSVERINQYFYNQTEDCLNDQKQNILLHKQNRQNDIIKFENVSLYYQNQDELQPKKKALENFCLSIKKGQKVAILGRTGSGKSSILNVLFRLYNHQQGNIYINGQDITSISLNQLREQLSIVPQFGFLYKGTIQENLDAQNLYSYKAIEDLLIKYETASQQKQKNIFNPNFMLTQGGSNISNGERQILNFLRVVLQDKEIICLDEATSNMDPKTDEILHKLLFEYVKNRTLLTITHRLENIEKYDFIVIMDQGQIVEQGIYNELIQKENGWLFSLLKQNQNE